MKTSTKVLPPELLLEEYRKLLWEDGVEELPLIISGNSMSPFLIHGRDTVYLSRPQLPAERGEILLYRRHSGEYILHRVYRVTEEGYTMVGDAQTVLEPGIREEQIIARVTRVERKGKQIGPGSFWWAFFAGPWMGLRPVRQKLSRIYALIKK